MAIISYTAHEYAVLRERAQSASFHEKARLEWELSLVKGDKRILNAVKTIATTQPLYFLISIIGIIGLGISLGYCISHGAFSIKHLGETSLAMGIASFILLGRWLYVSYRDKKQIERIGPQIDNDIIHSEWMTRRMRIGLLVTMTTIATTLLLAGLLIGGPKIGDGFRLTGTFLVSHVKAIETGTTTALMGYIGCHIIKTLKKTYPTITPGELNKLHPTSETPSEPSIWNEFTVTATIEDVGNTLILLAALTGFILGPVLKNKLIGACSGITIATWVMLKRLHIYLETKKNKSNATEIVCTLALAILAFTAPYLFHSSLQVKYGCLAASQILLGKTLHSYIKRGPSQKKQEHGKLITTLVLAILALQTALISHLHPAFFGNGSSIVSLLGIGLGSLLGAKTVHHLIKDKCSTQAAEMSFIATSLFASSALLAYISHLGVPAISSLGATAAGFGLLTAKKIREKDESEEKAFESLRTITLLALGMILSQAALLSHLYLHLNGIKLACMIYPALACFVAAGAYSLPIHQ